MQRHAGAQTNRPACSRVLVNSEESLHGIWQLLRIRRSPYWDLFLCTILLVAAGCGDAGPSDRPAESEATETPERARQVGTVGQTTPKPDNAVAPTTPLPRELSNDLAVPSTALISTPVVPEIEMDVPGYHYGASFGIAVLQTARVPSETREGWVDISLHIASLGRGGGSPAGIENNSGSVCIVSANGEQECVDVRWGTSEQVEAVLSATTLSAPARRGTRDIMPMLFMIEFEVAANATRASLKFGSTVNLPISLSGDSWPVTRGLGPDEQFQQEGPTTQQSEFLLGSHHGIAVTRIRRHWGIVDSLIDVELTVQSLTDVETLGSTIATNSDKSGLCLGGEESLDCVRIAWGTGPEVIARLQHEPRVIHWPRGKGWPTEFSFVVPNVVSNAILQFHDHTIPLSLTDMVTRPPSYHYDVHYSELQPESVVFGSGDKTLQLVDILDDSSTGDLVLEFRATNEAEASDFTPDVVVTGSRVSVSGVVFDGLGRSWKPTVSQSTDDTVPPGGTKIVEVRIPRQSYDVWSPTQYTKIYDDRPDAAILELALKEKGAADDSASVEVGYVQFLRTPDDIQFYAGSLLWRFETNPGSARQIVTSKNAVIVYGAGRVSALSKVEGSLLWEFEPEIRSRPYARLTLVDETLFVGVESVGFYALDSASGEVIWSSEVRDLRSAYSWDVAGDLLVYLTRPGWGTGLYALSANTGARLWDAQMEYSSRAIGPFVLDDKVIAGSSGQSKTMHLMAVDSLTGSTLWNTTGPHGERWITPRIDESVLYLGSEGGQILAIDTSNGQVIWTHRAKGSGESNILYVGDGELIATENTWQTVLLIDIDTGQSASSFGLRLRGVSWYSKYDRVLLSSAFDFYTLNAYSIPDGELVLQSKPHEQGFACCATTRHGVAYAVSYGDRLYALSLVSGRELWSVEVGGTAWSPPVIDDGTVYVTTDDGSVFAFVASMEE